MDDGDDVSAEFLIEASKRPISPPPASSTTAIAPAPVLSPEQYDGNIEYKLKLIDPTPDRIQHLVTQLKWRLNEGSGEAIYEIGVEDGGVPAGLSDEELEKSLQTLRTMAAELKADVSVLRKRAGIKGTVAEALVRQFSAVDFIELRVAVLGNVDAGKSTLLGVLTRGQLDNGRGLARLNIFRHKHEIETGRTSSISHEPMCFDSKGEALGFARGGSGSVGGDFDDDDGSGGSSSVSSGRAAKIINFIDLAGHERYLRTTLFGMTGHQPDYAMLIIGSNMGVVGMTKEHLGISLALRVPVFIVLTKIDISPENVFKETLGEVKRILKSPGCRKIPIVVRNEDDVVICARNFVSERLTPIFCVSNVTGKSVDLLKKFLNLLPSVKNWDKLAALPLEFQIDADWAVPGVGTVISGTVMKGVLNTTDPVLLGPMSDGQFIPVSLKSVHTKRQPVKEVHAGQSASVALRKILRKEIRKGMVLISPASVPQACIEFETEILVLYHATTISLNYEAVVHCGAVKQTARVVKMEDHEVLRTGDKAHVTWRFVYNPEYLVPNSRMIFREGRAKGVGRLLQVFPYTAAVAPQKGKYNRPFANGAPSTSTTSVAAAAASGTAVKRTPLRISNPAVPNKTVGAAAVAPTAAPVVLQIKTVSTTAAPPPAPTQAPAPPAVVLQIKTVSTATAPPPPAAAPKPLSTSAELRKSSNSLQIVRPLKTSGTNVPIITPSTTAPVQQQQPQQVKQQ